MPGNRHHCWGDLPSGCSRICLLRLSLPSATSRECGRQNPTQTLPRETNGRKRARSTASRLAVRLAPQCFIIKFMRRVIRRDAAAAAVRPCNRKPWLEWIAALVERRFHPPQQNTTATVVVAYSDASPKGWGGGTRARGCIDPVEHIIDLCDHSQGGIQIRMCIVGAGVWV
jgi:hypothetical protein